MNVSPSAQRIPSLPATPLSPAIRFAGCLVLWATAVFALLRSPWVQAAVLLPFAEWQARLASWYLGTTALPVAMAPDCSGLDVMALCVGATLAYPAPNRHRAMAAAGGVVLLLLLNIARIATLSLAMPLAGFGVLHTYVWPSALMLAAVAYSGAWMWQTERGQPALSRAGAARFARHAGALLAAYLMSIPFLAASGVLDTYAGDVAGGAAWLLRFSGVHAMVEGRVLRAEGVNYLITYECVTTPLLPLYLAAVMVAPWRRVTRGAALVTAIPLFAALSVVRLVTVAIPPLLSASPLPLTHGFNQLLMGACMLAAAAALDPSVPPSSRLRRAWIAVAIAFGCGIALGPSYVRFWRANFPAALNDTADLQGALLLLPAFQLALFAGLAFVFRAWRHPAHWIAAGIVLACSHALILAAALPARSFATPDTLALGWRALAVAVPAGAAALVRFRTEP